MNRNQIIALLKDGAYFDCATDRLHHPSFKKGSRKVSSISWNATDRALGIWGENILHRDDATRTIRIRTA